MEMFPLKIYAVCGFIYICLYAFDGKEYRWKNSAAGVRLGAYRRRMCMDGVIPLFLIFLGLFGNKVGIVEVVDAHGTAYVVERCGCHTASFFATTF